MIIDGKIKANAWEISKEIVERFNESGYSEMFTIEEFPPMGVRGQVSIYITRKEEPKDTYLLRLAYKDGFVSYDTKEKYKAGFATYAGANGLNMDTEYLPDTYEEIIKLFKGNRDTLFIEVV